MSGAERMPAPDARTAAALNALRSEMQALFALMPGVPPLADRRAMPDRGDVAVEALFDNMPV